MSRLLLVGVLFVLAGLCEIGGGYLVWGWMRDNKPLLWALVGAVVLALYGVVAALQPISEFGRVYAAYGGIFIALSWPGASSWMAFGPTATIYSAP
jgi:small multidrug resistance family-3 protein